jgi:membrane protease YdiL (CAAX protease family)
LIQRYSGFLFLGVLPVAVVMAFHRSSIWEMGLGLGSKWQTLLWTLGLAGLLMITTFFNASKKDNLALYPQIRAAHWSTSLLVHSALSWALYLLAYEVLFRGIFLFTCNAFLGPLPAIALNASLYSFAHLPKGKKETLGAIPFGLLICWITLSTHSLWTALLVHIAMAWSNEWFSLYYQPQMQWRNKS